MTTGLGGFLYSGHILLKRGSLCEGTCVDGYECLKQPELETKKKLRVRVEDSRMQGLAWPQAWDWHGETRAAGK